MKTEHLSTDTAAKTKEDKLDNQLRDSFPTSDPPSHSPGFAGAPRNRASEAVGPNDPTVADAAEKVKSGSVRAPQKY